MLDDVSFADKTVEAARAKRNAQKELDLDLFIKGEVDEVSLLFANDNDLTDYCSWAKYNLTNFNSVTDSVFNMDGSFAYRVRYEFFWLDDDETWRIEAMSILSGVAPLHDKFAKDHGDISIVHASWKEPGKGEYESKKKQLNGEIAVGGKTGFPMAAEYVSSYGFFSYFGRGDRIYLKPRINIRDATKEV